MPGLQLSPVDEATVNRLAHICEETCDARKDQLRPSNRPEVCPCAKGKSSAPTWYLVDLQSLRNRFFYKKFI